MNDKILALAAYLDVEPESISEGYNEDHFELDDGREYAVFTEEEADEAAREDVRQFIWEFGIAGFTESFQQTIIDNEWIDESWFEDAHRESEEFYADDIIHESSENFANRLVEEMYEAEVLQDSDFNYNDEGPDYMDIDEDVVFAHKDEFVEYLMEGYDNHIEWFKFNFGDESLRQMIEEHNLLDEDAVANEAVELDGRGHFLSGYDGEELELDDGYFAYRTN